MSSRAAAWIVFAALLASYAYFFQGGGWNPNARLDLTRALVHDGTIRIDRYWGNTGDWAQREGHRYANKMPGLSFVSVPFYAAAGLFAPDDPAAALRVRGYLANLGANALPSAALGALVFWTLGHLGLSATRVRAWAALVFGLGTLVFPYATAYYAHDLAAAGGFAAFAALLAARAAVPGRRAAALAALAGLAAGGAVLAESSAAVVAAILFVLLCSDAPGRRLLPAYVAGGLPMAAVFAGYNAAAFGHPLASALEHANPEVVVARDGALFGAPDPRRAWALLVSPYRGLLFTSPVLALAPAGFAALRRADRSAAWVCVAVPVGFLLLVASFHAWHGGWAPGPRYLVPCLPFLFVPVAFALARWRWLGAALGSVSVACMLAIAVVAVEIPQDVYHPLADFVLPFLGEGRVSVNPQGLDDFLPHPGYVRRRPPDDWSSFNLGELAFPHRVWSVAPLLGLWALAAWRLTRCTRGRGASPPGRDPTTAPARPSPETGPGGPRAARP